jgi:tetratricopeptide (TPR) repeat protein
VKLPSLAIAVVGWLLIAAVQPDDNTIVIERSPARSGVGPDFVEKAEKEFDAGDLQRARRDIDTAIQKDPTYWPAFYTRAKIYLREGKWSLAIQDCNELLRQDSTFIPAALLRSTANVHLGNYAAASKELDNIILLQPRLYYYGKALQARAWFRATCPDPSYRKPQQAIHDATSACNITHWRGSNYIDTLAVAYSAAGDFNSAIRYEQQAMQAPDAGDLRKTLQEHLALFQQHRQVTAH